MDLQVSVDKIKVCPRTAIKEEKPRLWNIMADIFPRYDEYQAKAGREIPLIILEPI